MFWLLVLVVGLLLLKMKNIKNIKNYIFVGLIALVVGGITGYLIRQPKTEFVPQEEITRYVDTCLTQNILCTLTTQDSLNVYEIIRKGKKSKPVKTNPKIEKVTEPTKEEQEKPVLKRVYKMERTFDNVTVWDSITVLGEIQNHQSWHKIDEKVKIEEKITTTTAVIESASDDSYEDRIRYLPLETPSKSTVGFSAGVTYFDSPTTTVGLVYDAHRFALGFDKQIGTDIKNLEGYGIQMTWKPFRKKKK